MSTQGCYRALNGASYRNYEATFGKRGQFCPIPIPVQPNEHCYRACRQALLQSLPEFFMVLLQGSPSVQLLPHGSFSASNTAACWNSANCPAVFQSRSHVSGNKQDQLHETWRAPRHGEKHSLSTGASREAPVDKCARLPSRMKTAVVAYLPRLA